MVQLKALFPLLLVVCGFVTVIHAQLGLPILPIIPIPSTTYIVLLLSQNLLQFLQLNLFDNMNPIATTNNLGVPTPEDTLHTLNYAFAIYCPVAQLEAWNCGTKCNNAGGTDNTIIDVMEDSVQKTRGMIAVNNARGEILVVFRGSTDAINFVADAQSVLQSDLALTGGTNVQVSQGFLQATMSLYDPLVTTNLAPLRVLYPNYKVVITGHSLGAAMAELTFALLKNSTAFGSADLQLFKYGSPRVGNIGFATWMNAKSNKVIRVVNKADLFSHIFLSLESYVHSGNEYWRKLDGTDVLCNRNVFEDPLCSNSLGPTYNTNDHLNYLGIPKDGCAV